MKRYSRFRIVLLAMGIAGILALTGMNLYSLYALHTSTVDSSVEKQREQLEDIVHGVRMRMWQPVNELWRIDMTEFRDMRAGEGGIPDKLYYILEDVENDPLYHAAYFMDSVNQPCSEEGSVLHYNPSQRSFENISEVPDVICDGLSMARTRMNVLAPEFKWPVRSIFDSYRSLTVALFNPSEQEIVGYLSLSINRDYLVDEIIAPSIVQRFGYTEDSGVLVWLDDWTRREMIAANTRDDDTFVRDEWDHIQRFPNMLEDWNIKMRYFETPQVAASKASFIRNVTLLAAAVFLLLGSLVFMYVAAQRERELSMRQASFLANVTHELKTPLAVMQAAGENLADGRVTQPERLRSYGKHIFTESQRLRKMIEKLLDVARNEAGQLVIKPALLRLDELVKQYIGEQESYLQQQGVEIDLQIDDHIPLVKVDQNSFETILGNLIENAVKYSPDEKYLGIRVMANRQQVVVEIEDHGTGIPSDSQKLIFDKFYRVEDTLTATTKGHGLGLSIVKNLTERNGGKISLSSEYGSGSTFRVSFPVAENQLELSSNGKTIDQKKAEPEYV